METERERIQDAFLNRAGRLYQGIARHDIAAGEFNQAARAIATAAFYRREDLKTHGAIAKDVFRARNGQKPSLPRLAQNRAY